MHLSGTWNWVTLVFLGLVALTFASLAAYAFRTGREPVPRLGAFLIRVTVLTGVVFFLYREAALWLALTAGVSFALGRYLARRRPADPKPPDQTSSG